MPAHLHVQNEQDNRSLMSFLALLGLALLVCLALFFAPRILGTYLANRVLTKVLNQPADAPRGRLDPESRFVIQMTESAVSCHRPDGVVETVRWDELQQVQVLTTSDGPFAPDCFWLLRGPETTGCCIPQGATGDAELLDRIQKLPGFDNLAFIEAMGSTQEAIFTCWQRPA